MKNILSIIVLLFVSVAITGCFKKDPKTDKEKISYAIGMQIGNNIKSQNIDVDQKMLTQALIEAVSGKEPKMTKEEVQKAMQLMQKQRFEKRQAESKKNEEDGKKFLEANKKKPNVKTTESGLQYEIVKEGKGKKPKATDKVKVHYVGTLTNGDEFDSSKKRNKPAEFPVNGVIKGWQEGLTMMKEGAVWKLYVPADLAYGQMGRPGIPGNSVLIFEVELLEVLGKK